MAAWLPLALAAPALLTVVNFIDKYIVEREVQDTRAMPIFAGLAGVTASIVLFLTGAWTPLPQTDALIIIFVGMLVIVGATFYFVALPKAQTSAIIILLQLTPVFVLVLAWLFLREEIALLQFAGFWLIVTAAMGISIEPGAGRIRLSGPFASIMIVSVLHAFSSILLRVLLVDPDLMTIIFYQGIGQGIGAALVYAIVPSFRYGFNLTFQQVRKSAIVIISLNEFLFLAARGLTNQALTLGPAARVSVLSGTQVFYGILFGLLLMRISPTTFREAVDMRSIIRKVFLAGVMFAGLWLVIR
ncbi:MAG: DMT family transporter [Anaerolineae bacterium]|nr:DMT family transporter [Anaerolineae bacterium]